MTPIRVGLANNHALVGSGIRSLLSRIAGIEVVAEAHDGHEAVQLVEKLRPGLVLMDIAMPGILGGALWQAAYISQLSGVQARFGPLLPSRILAYSRVVWANAR